MGRPDSQKFWIRFSSTKTPKFPVSSPVMNLIQNPDTKKSDSKFFEPRKKKFLIQKNLSRICHKSDSTFQDRIVTHYCSKRVTVLLTRPVAWWNSWASILKVTTRDRCGIHYSIFKKILHSRSYVYEAVNQKFEIHVIKIAGRHAGTNFFQVFLPIALQNYPAS